MKQGYWLGYYETVVPDLPTPSFPRTTARMVFSVWWWTWPGLLRLFPIVERTANKASQRFPSCKNRATSRMWAKYTGLSLFTTYRPDGTPVHCDSEGCYSPRGVGWWFYCSKKWNNQAGSWAHQSSKWFWSIRRSSNTRFSGPSVRTTKPASLQFSIWLKNHKVKFKIPVLPDPLFWGLINHHSSAVITFHFLSSSGHELFSLPDNNN